MSQMKLMPTPRKFDLAITGRCNLKCAYCFYADEMTGRSDLSTQQWLDFFDQLGELGVMDVTLTGGEVFSRPDLFELIDGLIANHMRYSLLTNGTLINEKTLEAFEVGKRRLRLNSIQVSIDGSTAAIHDQSRPASFARALSALRLLHQERYPVCVRVTINRHNYRDLPNIARLLIEDVGMPGFSTNEAFNCGATSRFDGGITLSIEQRLEVVVILKDLMHQYPDRISGQAGPLTLIEEQRKIQQAQAEGVTALPGRGSLVACGCIFNSLAILHDGTITPCHILSDLHLGNILADDLVEIWHNHTIMQKLRDRRSISLDEIEPCTGCQYRGYCTGGCPGGALYFNHDLNTRNPMNCYRILIGEEVFEPDQTM